MIRRLQQLIRATKPELAKRKHVLLRITFFIAALFIYRYCRSLYTESQHGYTMQGGDSINRYAPYIIIAAYTALYWRKLVNATVGKTRILHRPMYFIAALALALVPASFFATHASLLYLVEMGIELAVAVCLFFGLFGVQFYRTFRHGIQVAAIMVVLLQISSVLVDHYWHIFSKITMFSLHAFLPLLAKPFTIESEKYLVTVGDFIVSVGPACAGLGFLTGYCVLFIFALSLMLQQGVPIPQYKTAGVFVVGLLCMLLLNSLRVFLILGVGVYYSQKFAMSLFHNGIGAVLFLLFFFFFTHTILKRIWNYNGKERVG